MHAAGTAIAQLSAAVCYRHGQRKGAGIRHSRTQDLVCHNHPTNGASSQALHRKKPGGQEGMRSGKAQVSERTMVRCRHARSGVWQTGRAAVRTTSRHAHSSRLAHWYTHRPHHNPHHPQITLACPLSPVMM